MISRSRRIPSSCTRSSLSPRRFAPHLAALAGLGVCAQLTFTVNAFAEPIPAGASARAQAAPGARLNGGMLRFPALSADKIAFIYAGKVWTAPRDGGVAIPVASPDGNARFPRFSPDGKTIAMTAAYDGGLGIYTIPTDGGIPVRATFFPGLNDVNGWTPDGKILYASAALSAVPGQRTLLSVSPNGGMPTTFPIPYGEDGAVSPDGKFLAYTPSSLNFRTWKRYRGGWAQDIWLMDLQTKAARKVTSWEGNDTLPMWADSSTLYYLSDNGPESRMNLWKLDVKSGKHEQVTKFADYDVLWPSIGPGGIVFQHGASVKIYDFKTKQSKEVVIRLSGDRPTIRPRTIDTARFATEYALSPSAKRVLSVARGNLWSLPAKDGPARLISQTDGVRERGILWSPDGKNVAYLSDATGEYEIYLQAADFKTPPKQLTKNSTLWYEVRSFSPDSKYIHFADKSGQMLLCDVATGKVTVVDKDPSGATEGGNFSQDSRFLVYNKGGVGPKDNSAIWIYNVETAEKKQVTSGMFKDTAPTFDRKGEWLFYASSRIFTTPTYDENGTSFIYNNSEIIVAVPLRKDISSPFLPKTDEEPAVKPADKPAEPEKKPAAGTFFGVRVSQNESVAAPTSVQADDITGTWKGTITGIPSGEVTFTAEMRLAPGGAVTATITASLGNASGVGKYDAATKTLELAITPDGSPALTFRGKVNGPNMDLTASIADLNLTLKATRSGPAPVQTPPVAPPGTKPADPAKPAETKPAEKKMTIDFDGLEARGIALAIRPGGFYGLTMNAANHLVFVRNSTPGAESLAGIKALDWTLPTPPERVLFAGAAPFNLTPDGRKLMITAGTSGLIVDAAAGGAPEVVPTGGMQLEIDPRPEWRQILREAWRLERDFFYDPNMHGVDWNAVWKQYSAMLDDANSRGDVGYIIGEMIAELNVGHAYYSPGAPDGLTAPPAQGAVGVLACDFSFENGAYKISKIHRGAPWDTDAIGPLSYPGVNVKEGDYLLAVNGVPVNTRRDPWAALANMAGRSVTLTVSAKPTLDSSAREVTVRALGDDEPMRYRGWIEKNRQMVDKLSGGKVGYIYVPNTGVEGQSDLVRQYVGQLGKDALLIDDRWNGGGQIPTRFIELLNRPLTNMWARRDGYAWAWPPDGHHGPKAMLINGQAGSGGDAFPYYFRQAGLGKLIGTRTWGGLVGISGGPTLLDGARVTEPGFAFYELDGTWGIEGHGVDPDIEIVDDPSKMQNGADPQIEAAVKHLMEELKKKPVTYPKPPTYPNRSKMGIQKKDQ